MIKWIRCIWQLPKKFYDIMTKLFTLEMYMLRILGKIGTIEGSVNLPAYLKNISNKDLLILANSLTPYHKKMLKDILDSKTRLTSVQLDRAEKMRYMQENHGWR